MTRRSEANMRNLVARILAVALTMLPCIGVKANDSSAEFETGGLRFKKDPDIAMRAEDLSISMKQVKIAYTFFNRSAAAKTILVAFPMPDIVGIGTEEEQALPTDSSDNIFDFKVTADGVPVPLHLEQAAFADGIDQTERLRKLGIPLMPVSLRTNDALDRLPKAMRPALMRLGIAGIETYGTGGPMEDHLVAQWTLRSAFTWTQTFPAGRAIRLAQTYQPSVGGSAQTFIGANDWRKLPAADAYLSKYCIDPDLIRTIERARATEKTDYPPFAEQRIAYILKTGANWAGPIQDFHLTVDKGDAANLVSFCADGVTKTGPTTFDVHATNFTPARDLFILLLSPLR